MSKKRTRAELMIPEVENSVVVSPYFLRNRESSESMATATTNCVAKENASDPPAKKRKFFANVPKQEEPKQESMKVEVPRLKIPPPTKGEYLPEVADSIGPDLRLLFVGINPGRESSLRGHPYAHKSNLFWPLLRDSGLVGPHITCDDHRTLIHPPLRYGFTNVVSRPSRSADILTSQEYQQGVVKLKDKLSRLNPPPYLVCFVGMEIFRIFTGNKNISLGLQPAGSVNWLPPQKQKHIINLLMRNKDANSSSSSSSSHSSSLKVEPDVDKDSEKKAEEEEERREPLFYVMPSTSGRVSHYQKQDRMAFFLEIKNLLAQQKEQ